MVLVDANYIIRFFSKEPDEHYQKSKEFFEDYKKSYEFYLHKKCPYDFVFEIEEDIKTELIEIEDDLKYIN